MNKEEFTQRVASGLRNINIKPTSFLVVSEIPTDTEILSIPLLYSSVTFNPISDEEIPIIPLFSENDEHYILTDKFNRGFVDII